MTNETKAAAELPKTRHGCTCNTCHWCTWERSPIEAIKLLLTAEVEHAERLESVCCEQRNFYRADFHKGRRDEAIAMLRWITDMQKAESNEPEA